MTTPSRPSFDELAAGELDAQDVDTLARMAALYDRLDPVPQGLVDRIRFGITLDALHAEIADLQRSDDLAGVRSEGAVDAQTVTFTSSSLTTMVTITPAGADRVRIDGWAAPGGGVTVELRIVDETLTVTADADGRFVFEDVPHGLAQFIVRPPEGAGHPAVITPSIEL
ncbi:MAG: hypothetical protein QOF92_539 [Pseudonocardiales bacterium]|jgi:hypothetical protein|nr:hypothetical protein [Pseudonocardiales bacterium]